MLLDFDQLDSNMNFKYKVYVDCVIKKKNSFFTCKSANMYLQDSHSLTLQIDP